MMPTQPISELVWTPEMVRRFWAYESSRPENFFSFQVGSVLVRRFRKYLAGDVVDYGAGGGYLIEDLLGRGTRCAAVEADATEINRRFAGIPRFLGARSFNNLADWQGRFDVAFLVEVVEHLYDKELSDCLLSVHDLLKPHGLLIVTTPNNERRSDHFICSPESGRLFHRFQHVRSWTPVSLSDALTQSGFKTVQTGTTDFGASLFALRRTNGIGFRLARAIAKNIWRREPHLFAIAHATVGDTSC
jgi:2-polyprenyl-3-methyl-5-hydroxy-6-metoxy-1,4-benzoquinol methylase